MALASCSLVAAGVLALTAAAPSPVSTPPKAVTGPALYPLSKVKPGLILKGESVFSTAASTGYDDHLN